MKQRYLYFALVAVSAFFAFLAACGEGNPVNLEDESDQLGLIDRAMDDVTEVRIPDCLSGIAENCPDFRPAQKSSSSKSEPTPGGSSSSTVDLTCTGMLATGISGTAIMQPTVKCGTIVVPSVDITWTGAPDWINPVAKTYEVEVTANCGGSNKTAACGTLIVGSASDLNCTGMLSSVDEGTNMTVPTVKCGTSTVTTGIAWSGAPVWTNPAANTYDVSVTASCEGSSKTATCGTLTVNELEFDCDMLKTGVVGVAITQPTVKCGTNAVTTGLTWTGAPVWGNPAAGTYNNVSVTAKCGAGNKTKTCGTITVTAAPSSSSVVSSSSSKPSSSSVASSSSVVSSSSSVVSSSSSKPSSSSVASSSSAEGGNGDCVTLDMSSADASKKTVQANKCYNVTNSSGCNNVRFQCPGDYKPGTGDCVGVCEINGTSYTCNSSNNVVGTGSALNGKKLTTGGSNTKDWVFSCDSW